MAVCVDPLQHYVFGGMARLSVEEREACLATLPDGEAEARMAIFPDEPADHVPPMTPVRAKLEAEAEVKADEYRPPLNVAFILCVLWPFCDPLWLDLVARSATEGFNLGFRGPRGPDGNLTRHRVDLRTCSRHASRRQWCSMPSVRTFFVAMPRASL